MARGLHYSRPHVLVPIIDSVSRTLISVLNPVLDGLLPAPGSPAAVMHELQAAPPLPNPGVTVFLFAVNEDPHTRNRPRPRTDLPGAVRLRKPDITLELRYLITAWSDDHDLRQAMLERTVQTFYDEAILSGPQLAGDLTGTEAELKISLDQLSLEDRTRVWNSLNRPFKLSLIYTVRVVNVPATSEEQFTPVSRRTLRVGTSEVTV